MMEQIELKNLLMLTLNGKICVANCDYKNNETGVKPHNLTYFDHWGIVYAR